MRMPFNPRRKLAKAIVSGAAFGAALGAKAKKISMPQDVLDEYKRLGGSETVEGKKYRREYMKKRFNE